MFRFRKFQTGMALCSLGFASFMLVLLCCSASLAADEQREGYTPDVLELKKGSGLSLPPYDALTLRGPFTIEFWIVPDWEKDPPFDPVILSNAGPEGSLYMISMLRSRSGISVRFGGKDEIVPFEFTDGQMHFVAIVHLGEEVMVMIDNKIAGRFQMALSGLPSSGFWVGSADGNRAPFTGAIAGLRLWNTIVSPNDLLAYAVSDIAPPGALHPDIEDLVAISDFNRSQLIVIEGGENYEQ